MKISIKNSVLFCCYLIENLLVIPPNFEDGRKRSKSKEEDCFIQKCQWIKSLTIRQGYLQITRHSLKYFFD